MSKDEDAMNQVRAQTRQQGDTAIISVEGYLSGHSAGPLENAFQEVQEAKKILVIFREGDFLNSAGLAVLFDLMLSAKEQGKGARIVEPSPHFRKVFRIMGLTEDIEIFETEEAALQDW